MHILFACRQFDGVVGGVERMSTALMNALAERGHKISLLTWDANENAKSFYAMDPSINWHKVSMGDPSVKAGWKLRFQRAKKVRDLIRQLKPDAGIAFQDGPFCSLRFYCLGMHLPMICAERNSPYRHDKIKSFPPLWISNQVKRTADLITVQFDRYRNGYPAYLQSKIHSVPNHIEPAKNFLAANDDTSQRKLLLSTGRLSPEKQFQALIAAFGKIAGKFPAWDLTIVGEGSERKKLEDLIQSLPNSVKDRIRLPGSSNDVPSWLKKADLFCIPSCWEGFPNALGEAMAYNLPSVGYRDCDGVCDLIEDGATGLLADGNGNVDTLADKLSTLMQNDAVRAAMGKAAQQKSLQYTPEKIYAQWEQIFQKIAGIRR